MQDQNTPSIAHADEKSSEQKKAKYIEIINKVYSACLQSSPYELELLLQQVIDDGSLLYKLYSSQSSALEHIRHHMFFLNAFLYFRFSNMTNGKPCRLEVIADQINTFISRLNSTEAALRALPILYNEYCIFYNSTLSPQQTYSPLVRGVLDKVHSSLNTGEELRCLSVHALAKAFHVSPKYLSNRFARETGHALTHEINHIRILSVKFHLKYSDLSLEEIADKTGFSRQSYLTRRFKSETGISPSQYRKQTKTENAP